MSIQMLNKLIEEQKNFEARQSSLLQGSLKEWSSTIAGNTHTLIKDTLISSNSDSTGITAALAEAQERRSKVVQVYI